MSPTSSKPVAVGVAVPMYFRDGICSCFNDVPICLAGCCCNFATTGQLYERVLQKKGMCQVVSLIVSICVLATYLSQNCQTHTFSGDELKANSYASFDADGGELSYKYAQVAEPAALPGYCAASGLLSLLSFAGFVITGLVTCQVNRLR